MAKSSPRPGARRSNRPTDQTGEPPTATGALAVEAADEAAKQGLPADVYVVNGFPVPGSFFAGLASRYSRVLTIEDGLIGTVESGLRGFAAYAVSQLYRSGITLEHFGITDPGVAPSDHYLLVWEHYGMTAQALTASILETAG